MKHTTPNTEHKIRKIKKWLQPMFHVPCSMFCDSRGQAVILAVIFFMTISAIMGFGIMNPVLRQAKQASDFINTRASLYLSQSVNEDAIYRYKTNKKFVSPSVIILNGFKATVISTPVAGGVELTSSGNVVNLVRNIKTHLTSGTGNSFHYGLQSGNGGIDLNNSATINGNVFSNGPITGANSNIIKGTVVSAGPSGQISGVHATSSAYAHTISSSNIDGDAFYQSVSDTSVDGVLHPGSADVATSSLPIPDSTIAAWEAEATTGGTYTSPCPYSISGTVSIGPKKINCDLNISNDAVVTLTGHVWVVGDISISNQAEVKVSSTMGSKSVTLIADNPAQPTSEGRITLSNSSVYSGSGNPNSYLVMISQNRSAEVGGENSAITTSNSTGGKLLLYAPHGLIQLSNSIILKEVTAYKISMNNSAEINYESGLANLLFTSGPSGGYVFDSWREVQ